MFACLLFSLLFIASNVHAQVTSWTGASGTNTSFSNVNNWSNGVPTANSIVYINDTSCNTTGNCNPTMDIPQLTIAELHFSAGATLYDLYLYISGNLTVTNKVVLGAPSATTSYPIYVYFQNGNLTTSSGCTTTIYYTSSGEWFSSDTSSSSYTGIWQNWGAVTVVSSQGATGANPNQLQIGDYYSSSSLTIQNGGSITATDPAVILQFYYSIFQDWGGSYTSTWTGETTPHQTIQWYACDVWLMSSSFTNMGPLYFYSPSSSSYDYLSTGVNMVVFNVIGVNVTNGTFDGVNVLFNANGTCTNAYFTDDTFINSTMATQATLGGASTLSNSFLVCMNPAVKFQVIVASGSSLHYIGTNGLFGTAVLVNQGTLVFESNDDMYMDVSAFWINLGLMNVISYNLDYIKGSYFPSLTTPTAVGTWINAGTIQFYSNGGLDFEQGSGNFYQLSTGVLSFLYGVPTATSTPGSVQFADIALDGHIGIYFAPGYTPSTYQTLFTWKASDYTSAPNNMWSGSATVSSNDQAHTVPSPQQSCYDPTGGTAYAYPISAGLCSSQGTGYVTFSNSIAGGVSSLITDPTIMMIASQPPTCGAGMGCGQDVGISSNPPPSNGKSSGSILPISFSLFVSLLAYLYFSSF
jgi:hypothetical protein